MGKLFAPKNGQLETNANDVQKVFFLDSIETKNVLFVDQVKQKTFFG